MEGILIFGLLAATIALLFGDSAPPAVAPPVIIVQSEPTPQQAGCLPVALLVAIGLVILALATGS
jgi:hypothetical protein